MSPHTIIVVSLTENERYVLEISDNKPGKYCGLGLAGFPKRPPAVAKPAVSH